MPEGFIHFDLGNVVTILTILGVAWKAQERFIRIETKVSLMWLAFKARFSTSHDEDKDQE